MYSLINIVGWVGEKGDVKTVGKENVKVRKLSISTKSLKDDDPLWWECNFWGDNMCNLSEKYKKGDMLLINGVFARQEFYIKKSGENWGQ